MTKEGQGPFGYLDKEFYKNEFEREERMRKRLNSFIATRLFEDENEDYSAVGNARAIVEDAARLGFHGRIYEVFDHQDNETFPVSYPLEERASWCYAVLDEQAENSPALNQASFGSTWLTKNQIMELVRQGFCHDVTEETLKDPWEQL